MPSASTPPCRLDLAPMVLSIVSMALFTDRREAGRRLARALSERRHALPVVLALPRGGVPVAFEVALRLGAPLDVFVVRKLGSPGQDELAIGAIASGGVRVLNDDVIRMLAVSEAEIEEVTERETRELGRRERAYRGERPPVSVEGRTAILVDDGLATGASMRAAVRALRERKPSRIVVAVPVAAPDSCEALREEADEVLCAETPEPFFGVGAWYADFSQTSDREVTQLLARASSAREEAGEHAGEKSEDAKEIPFGR